MIGLYPQQRKKQKGSLDRAMRMIALDSPCRRSGQDEKQERRSLTVRKASNLMVHKGAHSQERRCPSRMGRCRTY